MSAERRTRLAVIMSALNEEQTVGDVIDRIPTGEMDVDATVIVVDDGSTDRTGEIADECGAIVIRHAECMGLAASFAAAMERALDEGADIVVNIDADGQFNPADIPALIAPILAGRADFVTATRFARKDYVPEMPLLKRWGNRWMSRLVNLATGRTRLTDVSCGFRAFSLKAALSCQLTGRFTHTQETIIEFARRRLRIAEVPLVIRGVREHGDSRMAHSVIHYGLRAGAMVLRAMFRTRPLAFFGTLACVVIGLGVGQGAFVFVHWCMTARTAPYKSLLLGSSLFITVGFVTLVLALVADMLDRVLDVQERTLYLTKLNRFEAKRKRKESGDQT